MQFLQTMVETHNSGCQFSLSSQQRMLLNDRCHAEYGFHAVNRKLPGGLKNKASFGELPVYSAYQTPEPDSITYVMSFDR